MRLSRRSDYALRALFDLADHFGHGPIPIRELAARNDIPRRFLEQIMIEMREAGWVNSVAGRVGGFELAVTPEKLTMGQVVRRFDGLLAPIGCVSVSAYEPCTQEGRCRFRRVLLEIRNHTTKLMDRASLATVLKGQPVLKEEVFEASYLHGEGI